MNDYVGADVQSGSLSILYIVNPFNTSADINSSAQIPESEIHSQDKELQFASCDKDHHYPVADVRSHLLRSQEVCSSFPHMYKNARRAFASCEGSLVVPLQGSSAIFMVTSHFGVGF